MNPLIQTETVTVSDLVKKIASYNLWANSQLCGFLSTKSETDLVEEVPSSYNSLKKTLEHIHASEVFWLSVLQQRTFVPPATDIPVKELFDAVVETSAEFLNYVSSLSEEQIQAEVFFTSPWAEATRGRFDFIQHAMNHSTYHRGQLVTIGRNLGYMTAPMTDYNFYLTYAY